MSHPSLSDLHDSDALITALVGPTGEVTFTLLVGDRIISTGPSARKLSQFAFANGAQSVKHDYNLRLEQDSVVRR